ncbi:unnamed protein product [Bursaphelenchus xylophilus]|uniref:(pine wood nematode) hypothetical protein n=1 Tax=Bursaphelenchus xylophilus TaxID=6326 RepID=A0A7I8WVF6_BURXY|nr:unnamed protein product [Bursaphelenchus xylophilus]CAG9117497.1 unnamed protein product [Bursaphelenchus xylophilus]
MIDDLISNYDMKRETVVDSDDHAEEGAYRITEEGTTGEVQRGQNILFLKSLRHLKVRAHGTSTFSDERLSVDFLKHPLPPTDGHELHESYRRPLDRLTDNQLRTLIGRYHQGKVDTETLSREEMIKTLEGVIDRHNQRLLKPKLLTNVNVLIPSELTINKDPVVSERQQSRTTLGPMRTTGVPVLVDSEDDELAADNLERIRTVATKQQETSTPLPALAPAEDYIDPKVAANLDDAQDISIIGSEEKTRTTMVTEEYTEAPTTAATTTESATTEITTAESTTQENTTPESVATTEKTSSTPKPAFTMLIRRHKTVPEEKKIELDHVGNFAVHDNINMRSKNNRLHSQFIEDLGEKLKQMKSKYESMKSEFMRRLRRINERHMSTIEKPDREELPPVRSVAAAAPTIIATGSKILDENHSDTEHGRTLLSDARNAQYDQYAQPPREIEEELHRGYNPLKVVPFEREQSDENKHDHGGEEHGTEDEKEVHRKNIKEFFESESNSSSNEKKPEGQIQVSPAAETTEGPYKGSTHSGAKTTLFKIEEEIKSVVDEIDQAKQPRKPKHYVNTGSSNRAQMESTTLMNEVNFPTHINMNKPGIKIDHEFHGVKVPAKPSETGALRDSDGPADGYNRPFKYPQQGIRGYRGQNEKVKRIFSTAYSSVNSGNTGLFKKKHESIAKHTKPARGGLIDSDNSEPEHLPRAQDVPSIPRAPEEPAPSVMEALKTFESELTSQDIWVEANKKSSVETNGEVSAIELVQQLQKEHVEQHKIQPKWHHHTQPVMHTDRNEPFNEADDRLKQCNKVACNFESEDLCNWESSVDTVNPGSHNYRYLLRRRAHRQADYVMRGWQNWRGRYRNSVTGIARGDNFNERNQHFAASYVKPFQRSTLSARINATKVETIEFQAWEAARNIQLRVCCDTTENCVFETEIGVKRGSRRWKLHYASCPVGTQKVLFECINHGIFQGACGVDNIRLLDSACPSVQSARTIIDSDGLARH